MRLVNIGPAFAAKATEKGSTDRQRELEKLRRLTFIYTPVYFAL
jgi:hypothetical protein